MSGVAGGDADEVEVITDPAEIAAAREAWRRWQDERLTRVLENPESAWYREGYDILQHDPERALASLVRLRDDAAQPPAERLGAVLALTHLGVPPDAASVAEIATTPSGNAIWHFLVHVENLFPANATPPPEQIRRSLAVALAEGDENTQQMAEQVVQRYGLSEFAPTLLKNARRGKSFRSLARLHPTAEVLEFLIRGAREWTGIDAGHCSVALIDFAEATRDEGERTRAIEAFHEYIAAMPAGDPSPITDVQLASQVNPPALARRLLAPMQSVARDEQVRQNARACLAELDAAEAKATKPVIDSRILDAFVRLGVITGAEADRGGAGVPEDQKRLVFAQGTPAIEVLGRLGRYVFVERIAERIPYRHDFLIRQLGELAAAPFRPGAVMETYRPLKSPDEDDSGVPGEYRTQFIHAGRLYRFAPPDLGYQYNVPALIAAVNRALADAGVADRFVALSWDSSAIEYLFAPPDALRAAAAELGFDLQETEE